jgi:hypothetical protein
MVVVNENRKKQKIMKQLRPYFLVIIFVLPVIILVLIRALAPGNFKPDSQKLAEASFTGSNLLNKEQVAAFRTKLLIVKLVNTEAGQMNPSSDTLVIAAGHLLKKENLKVIRGHDGPVLLVSEDPAISAKVWMILSQMGYHDLFILKEKDSSEVLKYKFRPDTSAGI